MIHTFISSLIAALTLLIQPALWAEARSVHVPVPGSSADRKLSYDFQLLIDPERRLKPSDLTQTANDRLFYDMAGHDVYQFSRGHFWIRITLVNDSQQAEAYHLIHHVAYTDKIQLYQLEKGQLVFKAQRGDTVPDQPEPNSGRLPNFILLLPPGPSTFYLLIDTRSPVNLRFNLMHVTEFKTSILSDFLFLGVLFGVVAVMIGYNIFLAIRLHNPSYYLYVVYISSFALVQLFFSGMAQYLLPESAITSFLNNEGIVIFAELTGAFASLFAIHFLDLRQRSPRLYRAILAFYPFSLLNAMLAIPFFDLASSLVFLTNSYISVVLLLAAVQGCLQRYRPAYFYLAAWGVLILGSLVTMLHIGGMITGNSFTTWSQFLGGNLEVILLSLALGDKMRMLQEETHQRLSQLAQELNAVNGKLQDHIENIETLAEGKTRDIKSMLAHVPQGIFMIAAKDARVMPDYSECLTRILGSSSIAGLSLQELLLAKCQLSSDQSRQIETVVSHALGEDILNFDLNHALLPHELVFVSTRGLRFLELDWNAIIDDQNRIEKILVTLRDTTELQELQHLREKQHRELDAIGKVLKVPGEKFGNFLATCSDFMGACLLVLHENQRLTSQDIKMFFMNVHTMKGMARTFYLDDIASLFHEIEGQLEPFHSEGSLTAPQLLPFFQKAQECLQFYQQINTTTLGRGPASKSAHDQAWIRAEVHNLADLDTTGMKDDQRSILRQVIARLEERYAVNLEKSLENILQSLPKMAETQDKASPQVIFEADDIMLSCDGQILAERIFIHLLNNAIDHGIETVEERRLLGKPDCGVIRIRTWMEQDQMLIAVQDDGQGLNLKKIVQKGRERGLLQDPLPNAQGLAQLIFEPGFSTKDEATMTSGRGVGMDAVRTYLHSFNSSIALQLLETQREPNNLAPLPIRFILRLDKKLFIKPNAHRLYQVA